MNREIENRVLEFIHNNKLIENGDRILLGLSGGPDSVFGFHFLKKFARKLGIEFAALHLNHMLRGADSDLDEKFCTDLCAKENVFLYKHAIDISILAANSDKSIEEIARNERYRLFTECSLQQGFTKIFTAHNTDDNTETVFLNLIKGGGVTSLAGIPIKRDNIIRPMLCLTKDEILDYLKRNGIEYRIDSSNLDSRYERNFLRNEILPKIKEKINPRLNESVLNSSSVLSNFYAVVSGQIEDAYNKNIVIEPDIVRIKDALFSTNRFLAGEVIKKVFTDVLEIEFSTVAFNMIFDLNENQVGRKNQLRDNWWAVKERESIDIFSPEETAQEEIKISIGETVDFGNKKLSVEEVNKVPEFGEDPNSEFISADNLDDIFILRKWKPGDLFHPLGMKGQKKISDFLTDIKISNKERKDVYVLINRNKVVWLVGLRIDNNFKLNNNTTRILKLCLK